MNPCGVNQGARHEIVAAPWMMWDATALLLIERASHRVVGSRDRNGLNTKSMGADG